jgi:hypothetical protein
MPYRRHVHQTPSLGYIHDVDNRVYVQYFTTIVYQRRCRVMLPCHVPDTKYTVPSPNRNWKSNNSNDSSLRKLRHCLASLQMKNSSEGDFKGASPKKGWLIKVNLKAIIDLKKGKAYQNDYR